MYEYGNGAPSAWTDPHGLEGRGFYVSSRGIMPGEDSLWCVVPTWAAFLQYGVHWAMPTGSEPFIRRGGAWAEWLRENSEVRLSAQKMMKHAAEEKYAQSAYTGSYQEVDGSVFTAGEWHDGDSVLTYWLRRLRPGNVLRAQFLERVSYQIDGTYSIDGEKCTITLDDNAHKVWDIADAHAEKRDYIHLAANAVGRWIGRPGEEPFAWFPMEITWDTGAVTFDMSSGAAADGRGDWPFN